MKTNKNSLAWAEEQLGHHWDYKVEKRKDPVEYEKAPKLDEDIVVAVKNLKGTEKETGSKYTSFKKDL